MSAFAGMVTFDGAPVDKLTEDTASRAITRLQTGRAVTRRLDGALFAQRTASTAGDRGEPQPLTFREGRALFVALARLDNRDELGATLGLTPPELASTHDAHLILRMLERWGDTGVARCLGAFAFALWDSAARELILGRDCLGNRALFYHCGQGGVAFATTLGALLALPGVPREIDELTLAHFMVVNNREPRRTFYRGIERVPSRTLVTIDRSGVRHRPYWSPDLNAPPPYRRDEDYIERARELFDLAVAAAVRDTPHVAISSSGGLDSSAIAATAARLGLSESITCFTLVPPAGTRIDVGRFRYLDERDKMEALARMHPSLAVRFIAPDRNHRLFEDDMRIFTRANLPVYGAGGGDAGAHLTDAIAGAGYRTLLIGNYGNFGLSWWGSFSLVELLRAGQWSAFAHELRATARESHRSLARTLAGDVLMLTAPIWLRSLIYRLRGRDPHSVARYSVLNPAFIAEFDLVRRWQEQEFDPWFGLGNSNPVRFRAYWLFDNNQYFRDMRGMSDETAGFELRDPHADRRLLAFVLRVPEPMFRENGVPRSFARRVLADRLPRQILDERRRGTNTPIWFRLLDARRQDIARDIERLEASPLASRLIDVPRLKRLMAEWPKDEQAAEQRLEEYKFALARGVHVGRFLRWVEGGNA
jgi:asparagine synthase (glutamine-hydrolysing)